MDRRRFIRNVALATGGILVGTEFLACTTPAKKKQKVIIIGAGFAGLAAAYKLHKNKIDFVVLEARNRIGGRVFSNTIDEKEKLVVELGAEWIGLDHERVIALCEELGLETFDDTFNTRLICEGKYYETDEWSYSKEWEAKFDELIKHYKTLDPKSQEAIDMDKISWWRYLVNNGCDGKDLLYRELLDSTDFGESILHESAYAALGEYASSVKSKKNQMDRKIRGGNNQLAFAIQDKIGKDKINLQHVVEKIEQNTNEGKVTVTCRNKKVFEGTAIICTAPTIAVRKIKWEPALPDETMLALNELEYGRINKNAMLFSERFWKDESFDLMTDTPGHYFYHATKNQSSKKGVLISYTIGDKAPVIKAQTDEWRKEETDLDLAPGNFGDTKSLLEKQVDYYWGDDEFTGGAYAMYGVGQWFDVLPKLRKSHELTHFAGEHLSDEWQGFMEGAIETGEAAAAIITNPDSTTFNENPSVSEKILELA
jgi:monoamine oxidase